MIYRVVDNAPNWELRIRRYKNKGQALLYARNLKKHLAIGYRIRVERIDTANSGNTIATFNSIGNHKGVKIIKI